jgi:hypothetical protein
MERACLIPISKRLCFNRFNWYSIKFGYRNNQSIAFYFNLFHKKYWGETRQVTIDDTHSVRMA